MKKYVLITGGDFINKGSEAMVITLMSFLKKRFPEYRCIMLSDNMFALPRKKLCQYNFEILSESFCISNPWDIFAYYMKKIKMRSYAGTKMRQILENSAMMFDVSGFALGDQWGYEGMIRYLYRIHIAQMYNIKLYLMPQSFGPFHAVKGIKYHILQYLLKKYLKYPAVIMAREKAGFEDLQQYCSNNLVKTFDMVLLNHNPINLDVIWKKVPRMKEIEILPGSVAVVPNTRLITHGIGEKETKELYMTVINKIREFNKSVYLIAHADEDHAICEQLFEAAGDDKVHIVREFLNCVEYSSLIKKFQYAVISRYHGAVHAYKAEVPCILIGWADKYNELAADMDQGKYAVDVRQRFVSAELEGMISAMDQHYLSEKSVIAEAVYKLQTVCDIEGIIQERG